jgi:phosphonoacetate hydrolase
VIPSFTNPNNLSIVTGAPPSVHGICGNYLFDVASGTEVMMNDPKWLRAPTLLAELARAAARWPWSPPRTSCERCSDMASTASASRPRRRPRRASPRTAFADVVARVGMPVPSVYSAELSEFVFAAGVELMSHGIGERRRPT